MRPIELLPAGQVERVIDRALDTLAAIGVRVQDAATVERLAGAGASVDGARVRIPRTLCERCIDTAPAAFDVYDRDASRVARIGDDTLHFVPGSAATQLYDYESRVVRPATTSDVIDFVAVSDALPVFALQSTGLVPGDVDARIADRFRLLLAIAYGGKPIVTGTFSDDGLDVMIELMCAVRGGAAAMRDRPLAIVDCCATSPLAWDARPARDLAACALSGLPAEVVPAPLIGATAPATRLGTLVQHTAECISGVVIHQLARAGSPVVYGAAPTSFDMRAGTAAMASPDAAAVAALAAQVGRRLGLPVHAYLGLSDAKTPDYQSGMEVMAGALLARLCGVNVAAGAGLLNYVNCQSLEKLALDHESCRAALALASGDTDAIDAALPSTDELRACIESGSYLTSEHTRRRFRTALYFPSEVVDRSPQDVWEKDGRPDAAERAHGVVQKVLRERVGQRAPASLVERLDEIITADASRLGIEHLPDWRARS